MAPTTPQDWEHLGRTIRRYRLAAGLRRQSELAEAVGLSARTIGNYERGREPEMAPSIPDGYRAVASYFRWPSGSLERVLAGGEPEAPAPAKQLPAELEQLAEPAFRVAAVVEEMGAPAGLVLEYRIAAAKVFDWAAGDRDRPREDYALAAYRPHEEGQGPPADDAVRIHRAMEDT